VAQILSHDSKCVDDNPQDTDDIEAKRNPAILFLAVLFVVEGKLKRVVEDSCRLTERDAVFSNVRLLFAGIPDKLVTQSLPPTIGTASSVGLNQR